MSAVAVEVRDLVVTFGDFTAVDGISFAVSRGEIFGFLGANGAGKTTTIRVLCGLLPPTSGFVRVAGVGFEDGERAIKAKVGYMSQKFTLYNDMTVGENLDFIASLRKLDPSVYLERRRELFEFISFNLPADSPVQDLPGGIKQQVSLAAALLHDPEIVFLDEPTAGVSPAARDRFWRLIRRLAERGKTVFVTTHHMDEAEHCGRIALMREGRLVATDSSAGLKATMFPTPVFEFDPKEALSFAEIASLQAHEAFSFVQPYGLRFHAAIRSVEQWERVRPQFESLFRIRPIRPSLEDVFIRAVEERT
ncbi:MAG TPA: ABC transporter ATP-binding protein [Nitrospiria bacterium]|nr:ABC transporter ATP-binding protein [Nitrospiria bacterium]